MLGDLSSFYGDRQGMEGLFAIVDNQQAALQSRNQNPNLELLSNHGLLSSGPAINSSRPSLYCQLPFSEKHRIVPGVIAFAPALGRTPSSVAMRLGKFANCDPFHKARGIYRIIWSFQASAQKSEDRTESQFPASRTLLHHLNLQSRSFSPRGKRSTSE